MPARAIDDFDAMTSYQLEDAHRRIANILAIHPQDSWTLEETQAVLAALSGIVRVRQGGGDVALRVTVTLAEPARELVDNLVVWEIGGGPDHLDNAGYLIGLEVTGSD